MKNQAVVAVTLDAKTAAKCAVFAMMANNCYHAEEKRPFELKNAGWHHVDWNGSDTSEPTQTFASGFACDLFLHNDGERAVIAFRGTDSPLDWFVANLGAPLSVPYKQATKVVDEYRNSHPLKVLTIVGHSLGGGMALGTSARLGVPAYAFNPSPRVFDGLGDEHKPARRVVVYQHGDILKKIGKFWFKIGQLVQPEDVYSCAYSVPEGAEHRIDLLALNLGRQGSSDLSTAGEVARRLVDGYVPAP